MTVQHQKKTYVAPCGIVVPGEDVNPEYSTETPGTCSENDGMDIFSIPDPMGGDFGPSVDFGPSLGL